MKTPCRRLSRPINRSIPCHRGLTLIECLVALAIVITLLGSALPSFGKLAERRHLEGTAAQLATDIQHTRSLAVAQADGQRLSFRADAAGSCYVVHDGPANACRCQASGAVQCVGGAQARRTVFFPAGGPVQLRANVGSILFHPVHGTSTPTGTLRVVARSGAAVHQIVNIMGRTRACSPNGVTGYPTC
jgi:type IV fimbrial biogenesis protein FimT